MPPDPNVIHRPVLLAEVLAGLNPQPGQTVVDVTLGGGGHAAAIRPCLGPGGLYIGLDRDPEALQRARARLTAEASDSAPVGGLLLAQSRFRDLSATLDQLAAEHPEAAIRPVSGGILADLGVSSFQLDQAERGFSFRRAAPLDMRMSPDADTPTAADWVNDSDAETLANLFWELGEERLSRPIAATIVHERPIHDTLTLANLVARVYRRKMPKAEARIHPATRVFQALRMAVNDEMGELDALLAQAIRLLAPGARLAVISFHSLEDRRVKQFFQRERVACICPPRLPICQCGHQARLRVLTARPIEPTEAECDENPRARSARLRVAERLPEESAS